MRRWQLTFFALLITLALSTGSYPITAKTSIEFWHQWGGGEDIDQAFQNVAREFEKLHPDIEVSVTATGAGMGILEKLTLTIAGGAQPDLAVYDERVSSYVIAGLLEPITHLMQRDGISKDDFWLPSYRETVWEGETWALSWGSDPNFGFYWNKTMFELIGLDSERPPTTIRELEEYNKKLTMHNPDDTLKQVGVVPWWTYGYANSIFTWGWAFGGEFYNIETGEVTADHPNNVRALEWMDELVRFFGGMQAVDLLNSGLPSNHNSFMSGRIAMAPWGPWELPRFWSYSPDLRFGISFVPHAEGAQPNPTWVGGHKIGIPRGAKNIEEAWEFLKFIAADPQGTAILAAPIRWFPAYRKSAIYNEYRRDRYMAPYVKLIETARHQRPVMPAGETYFSELDRAVGVALNHEKPPRQALEEVKRVVEIKLAEILASAGN